MRSRRMSWSRERSCGNEAGKILWELPAYTRGRGLDVGCGQFKAYPHFIGVDDYTDTRLFGAKIKPDVASKADRLGPLARFRVQLAPAGALERAAQSAD